MYYTYITMLITVLLKLWGDILKKLYVLLLIILVTFVGCTPNSSDYSSLDTLLKSQEYTYPITANTKCFSIIIHNPKNISKIDIIQFGCGEMVELV